MYQVHFLFDTLMGAVWLVFDVDESPNDRVIVSGVYRRSGPIVPVLSHGTMLSDMCLSQSESFIFYFVPFTLFMPRATLNERLS